MFNRFVRTLSVLLAAVIMLTFAAAPVSALPADAKVTRIGGSNRIETASLIAGEGWSSSNCALLANAYSFPDALAGVPLAGALNAPILLTGNGSRLEDTLTGQLKRLGVHNVYILGGKSAVSEKLADQLRGMGCTVTRLAGSDRFGTAVAIARKLNSIKGNPGQLFFASSANYPDALAAGPAAAALGSPILYIRPDGSLDRSTSEYVSSLAGRLDDGAVILGGNAAVGSTAADNLKHLGVSPVERISGSNRYATALAVNDAYPGLLTADSMVAATGTAFPDALAGGALAAITDSPIVLLPDSRNDDIAAFIDRCSPSKVYILGGESAVPQTVADSYFSTRLPIPSADEEMRAVWIPYLCQNNITPASIDKMVQDCVDIGANTIIFHVRPFGDALYESDYFPWSHVISGTQGVAPAGGFDPLEYAVEKAHANNLELHAWINPLRIQLVDGSRPTAVSADNPYTIWRSDDDPSNDDWVVDYKKGKFYNPAYPQVRQLLIDGMIELAENYDIDGIHWDDYFYPAADDSFNDSLMYQAYIEGGGTMTLLEWRTDNINRLIRSAYSAVKAVNPDCSFGISPQGNIGNCLRIGANVYEWCSTPGYIDYICPQVYWTFDNTVAPFARRCAEWRKMITCSGIDLYIGLALYKAAGTADGGKWQKSDRDIAEQIECLRGGDISAEGFMLYSYQYFDMVGWEGEVSAVRRLLTGTA